ncbi:MAG: efflux RND transporter periplasmic adaptor subunit [Deltaproteobacteria bacterium]
MKASIGIVLIVLCACRGEVPQPHASTPSSVEHGVAESEITRVHLTEEAIARLGIRTSTVGERAVAQRRRVGGEVIIPPGHTLALTAPVAGLVRMRPHIRPGAKIEAGASLLRLVPFAPTDRDTRARAQRELAAARATLEAAQARLTRAKALAEQRAGSERAVEEATATRDTALADVEMAQARARATTTTPLLSDVTMDVRAPQGGVLRAVAVADGQSVTAGALLAEVVAVQQLWVRVPLFSGDLARLAPGKVLVRSLARDAPRETEATAVAGPPTSNPTQATVDRYYALDEGARLAPGERVLLSLPMSDTAHRRTIPSSAVLYDASGAQWVYVADEPNIFRRARVQTLFRDGSSAVLARGPSLGEAVVKTGAVEIFGAEFEPGH